MRKKKIIEQNALLFKQIEGLQGKIKELTKQLEEKDAKIKQIECEEPLNRENTAETPLETVKEKVLKAVFNAEDYGAKAIGKIVVAASTATSALAGKTGTDKVEVVNLILGKAEVAKAEILNAVSSEEDENQKKIIIDNIVEKSCDYFNKTANES